MGENDWLDRDGEKKPWWWDILGILLAVFFVCSLIAAIYFSRT